MRFVLLFDFLHNEKTGIEEPIHTIYETALLAARKATRNCAGYAPAKKTNASLFRASHIRGAKGLLIPAHFSEVVDLAVQTCLRLLLLEKLLELFLQHSASLAEVDKRM